MVKKWFLAIRPWSFTAAVVPVTLGSIMAAYDGSFNWILFILLLIGGVLIQAGTNLANTYGDYISGVDTAESTTVNCRELVDNIIKPKQMLIASLLVFSIVASIGLYFVYLRGVVILCLGIIGIVGGYTYTLGPSPYKYKGLGSILVFFLMGPLMSFGSYYVQTGVFNWTSIWVAVPIAFLVSGIMHTNDLRDMYHDKNAGITTLALILGEDRSFRLYHIINCGAFISVIILVATNILPIWGALPLLLLPKLIKTMKNTQAAWQGNKQILSMLEPQAGQFHFMFGLVFIIGLTLNLLLN